MNSVRVLLTGAECEIGRRLLEALASRGVVVQAFDGDVADEASRGEVVAFAPSVVVHLAERKGRQPPPAPSFDKLRTSSWGRRSDDADREADQEARVNILGTINMLHAAKEAGAERFVFGSSVGAASPRSPYDVSKLAGERYCESYRAVHGLPFVALRLPEEGSEDEVVSVVIDAIGGKRDGVISL